MTRQDIRSEDVRAPFAVEEGLKRRRQAGFDKFKIPDVYLNDPQISYEWKRASTMGAPDSEHQLGLAENHWRPVMADQMPGMMPPGHQGAIERGGMILMWRPAYLTEEATQETLDLSRQQVRTQEERLGLTDKGTLPRTRPQVTREIRPVTPEDRKARTTRAIPE